MKLSGTIGVTQKTMTFETHVCLSLLHTLNPQERWGTHKKRWRFQPRPFEGVIGLVGCCSYTSIAARGGGGSFKRLKLYNSEEHVPIESFGKTLIHWTFFLMTRTKLAFVGFVAAGNSLWHQVLDDVKVSAYAPNSTQYNSVLQSSEKCYPSTILYYKVLLQYYSVLQSTTPESTTPVLQSTTPVLLRTTKY